MVFMVMAATAFMMVSMTMLAVVAVFMATSMLMVVMVVVTVIALVAMVIMGAMVVVTVAVLVIVAALVVVMIVVALVPMVIMTMGFAALRTNGFLHQLFFQGLHMLHSLQYLIPGKLLQWGCDNGGFLIERTQKLYCCLYLFSRSLICSAENDCSCILNLIIEELTKISHIHLALCHIHHGGEAVELQLFRVLDVPDCLDDV